MASDITPGVFALIGVGIGSLVSIGSTWLTERAKRRSEAADRNREGRRVHVNEQLRLLQEALVEINRLHDYTAARLLHQLKDQAREGSSMSNDREVLQLLQDGFSTFIAISILARQFDDEPLATWVVDAAGTIRQADLDAADVSSAMLGKALRLLGDEIKQQRHALLALDGNDPQRAR